MRRTLRQRGNSYAIHWLLEHERHRRYPCARLDLENSTNLSDQKRLIAEFAEKKGWNLAEWYEEPEQSAVYDVPEQRPVFARLLHDASARFQVVLCSASMYWSWYVGSAYSSLDLLRQLEVWWATADGRWDINTVWQKGIDVVCTLRCPHRANRRRAGSRTGRKEGNECRGRNIIVIVSIRR